MLAFVLEERQGLGPAHPFYLDPRWGRAHSFKSNFQANAEQSAMEETPPPPTPLARLAARASNSQLWLPSR